MQKQALFIQPNQIVLRNLGKKQVQKAWQEWSGIYIMYSTYCLECQEDGRRENDLFV
jgi:hypothetical protein